MLQCSFRIKLTKLKKQRVFGQPQKMFWETDLYLQLMCLETDGIRAWRAFSFLKGST